MNKAECLLLKSTIAQLFFAGFLVLAVFAIHSGAVLAAESEGKEVLEPGKVGHLEALVEKMIQERSIAKLGIELYGFVDLSYTQNFKNPFTKVNQNRIFDDDSNSFRVQLAQIVLEKEAKTGGPLADAAGFRIKLNFGEDAEFTGGSFSGDDVDFQEVYAQFIAPIGNGIDLRIGRMNTLIGYEVIESPYNLNFSRSWLFGFGQPFTTTGLRAAYNFSEKVSLAVGVINDFRGSISDNNNSKGVESALSMKPTDWLGLTAYGYYTGNSLNVGSHDGLLLGGGIIDIQALESTEIVLEAYYANQVNGRGNGQNTRWDGFAGYVIHDFTEQWGIRFRGEIFEDAHGGISCFGTNEKGGKPGSCAGGIGMPTTGPGANGQTLWETTYTLQYKPVPSLITRLEFRYDKSDEKTFLKGTKAVDNQETLAVQVIYLF